MHDGGNGGGVLRLPTCSPPGINPTQRPSQAHLANISPEALTTPGGLLSTGWNWPGVASLSGSQVTVNLLEQGRGQAGGWAQAASVGKALAVPAFCSGGLGGRFSSSGVREVG